MIPCVLFKGWHIVSYCMYVIYIYLHITVYRFMTLRSVYRTYLKYEHESCDCQLYINSTNIFTYNLSDIYIYMLSGPAGAYLISIDFN